MMAEELRDERLPHCPYQGLEPFTENDRRYFFGREEEQETIGSTLLTAGLTVLYGPSGVGKTSVLRAGVIPFVEQQPAVTLVLFRKWQHDGFDRELKTALAEAVARKSATPLDIGQPLDVCLRQATALTRGTVAVIFDQFEEYLLYHPATSERGRRFDREFARSVNDETLDANFLVTLREDSLAKLDRFQPYIPDFLSCALRLDHLDEDGARRAIEGPVERYNEILAARNEAGAAWKVDPALVPKLIEQVRVGKVVVGEKGKGLLPVAGAATRVETPFLQMVLLKLWTTEQAAGSRELRATTLDALKGAQNIVRDHVGRVMATLSRDERIAAARMIDRLVTPSGSKIAYTEEDLLSFAGDRKAVVPALIDRLADKDRRLLRATAPLSGDAAEVRYEIFHDVLSGALLEWRTRFLHGEEERTARKRLWKRLGAGAAVVVAGFAVILWMLAKDARSAAQTAALEQRIREMEARQQQTSAARTPSDVQLLQQLLARYRESGNKQGEVSVLLDLAGAVEESNEAAAVTRYQEAARIADNPDQRAEALVRQAGLLADSEPARARKLCEEAVRLATGRPVEATTRAAAGDVYRMLADYDRARKNYSRAGALFLQAGATESQADMLYKEAETIRDDSKAALLLLNRALALYEKINDNDGITATKVAISARQEAVEAPPQAVSLKQRVESELAKARSAGTGSSAPCAVGKLDGWWIEIDQKSRQATTTWWRFELKGAETDPVLSIARLDSGVSGTFYAKGDRFHGSLAWADGDRWSDVQILFPRAETSCRYVETNRAFAFLAAPTGLDPRVEALSQELIRRAAAEGITIKVISGWISPEDQERRYAQGRTQPGKKITNSRAGKSNHNYGYAFDVGVFVNGRYVHDEAKLKRVGELGEQLGLIWGGRWTTFRDLPHFELEPGGS